MTCAPKTGFITGETYCKAHGREAGWPCQTAKETIVITAEEAILKAIGLHTPYAIASRSNFCGVGDGMYIQRIIMDGAVTWSVLMAEDKRIHILAERSTDDEWADMESAFAKAKRHHEEWAPIPGLPGAFFPAPVVEWIMLDLPFEDLPAGYFPAGKVETVARDFTIDINAMGECTRPHLWSDWTELLQTIADDGDVEDVSREIFRRSGASLAGPFGLLRGDRAVKDDES